MRQDELIKVWCNNQTYRKKCDLYLNEYKMYKLKENSERKNYMRLTILYLIKLNKKFRNSFLLNWLCFFVSIFLRLLCIYVLIYVLMIMIKETDSWIPLINLVFCFGILVDLVYFVCREKEHTG